MRKIIYTKITRNILHISCKKTFFTASLVERVDRSTYVPQKSREPFFLHRQKWIKNKMWEQKLFFAQCYFVEFLEAWPLALWAKQYLLEVVGGAIREKHVKKKKKCSLAFKEMKIKDVLNWESKKKSGFPHKLSW